MAEIGCSGLGRRKLGGSWFRRREVGDSRLKLREIVGSQLEGARQLQAVVWSISQLQVVRRASTIYRFDGARGFRIGLRELGAFWQRRRKFGDRRL